MSQSRDASARTLEQELNRIVDEQSIDGLDAAFHGAVRPVAQALVERGASLSPESLQSLSSSAEIAAVVAAVHLRSFHILEFWGPLLKHCASGSSPAPVPDLRRAARQARVLMDLLGSRESSEMRDKVLRMATEAAARIEKWLPNKVSKGGPPAPARYRRGVFQGDEDEDGVPRMTPRTPPPPTERVKPESPLRTFFGWVFTLLAVAAMAVGTWWFVQSQEEEPLPLSHFQSLVPHVKGKRVEGSELVLTLASTWGTQRTRDREADMWLLRSTGEREGVESLRLVDREGELLGTLGPEGSFVWGERVLEQDRARDSAEALDEAVEQNPLGTDEDGKLLRPLRADEIPDDE